MGSILKMNGTTISNKNKSYPSFNSSINNSNNGFGSQHLNLQKAQSYNQNNTITSNNPISRINSLDVRNRGFSSPVINE